MQTSEKKEYLSSFGPLWNELKRRLKAPTGQVTFWMFLFLGVCGFGACGIWVELDKYAQSSNNNLDGIQTAIFTFFPALGCTATMQIIISDTEKKYMRSVGFAAGILMLLAAFWLVRYSENIMKSTSILIGLIASVIAILTWWIANGEDPIFDDNVKKIDIPTGGDIKTPLNGDIKGFKIN